MAECNHRRDALHAELGCQLLVLVDVDLDQLEGTLVLFGHRFEQGTEGLAGTAPLGPEVDDNGNLLAALQNSDAEVLGCDVLDESVCHGAHR